MSRKLGGAVLWQAKNPKLGPGHDCNELTCRINVRMVAASDEYTRCAFPLEALLAACRVDNPYLFSIRLLVTNTHSDCCYCNRIFLDALSSRNVARVSVVQKA